MAVFAKLGRYQSTGLLLMRIGLGIMMILHGYPKIMDGKEHWVKLGGNMKYLGINAYPEIWGFLASITETLGGLFLLIGFFFRPSCFFLMFTMLVAALSGIYGAHAAMPGIMGASEAIELGSVFLALFIIGPGKYSVDKS